MFRRLFHISLIVTVGLSLTSFRMPAKSDGRDKLIYDVRGSFVTARPEISRSLVIATDMLVDEAIRTTSRPVMLPRTIIVIRIDKTSEIPLLIGSRHEAKVTVQAVAVGDGEPIAEGSFKVSIYLFGTEGADQAMAQKIAERIVSEFKLDGPRHGTLASALFE
ncbi:hypothetical protein EPK99_06865 [Neorhizobium lilium]|uniref:Uncharacterized protein n=1 Tax=Neorhizobium lilium TaxID=2503024 RepID=A0A444LH27_9HYPH|nr:hypothetical protein [Neorhizobium lilium]RWX78336.1 hypothetical protein EPK99_06865 [Neorhizobium lilium]